MSTSPPPESRPPEPMWDQLFELNDARRRAATPQKVKRKRAKLALVTAGAVVVVAVVALVAWLVASGPSDESSSTATESSEVADPDQMRLADMVPAGYPQDSCVPAASAPGTALAAVSCGRNTDPNGPPSATYTLMPDKAALTAAFEQVVASSTTVVCPGRIQSPGPWRRNATPDQISGILFCGIRQGHPMVAWTDEARMLLSQAHADAQGPTFPELYAWWSSHS
ncbi:hypothetical protein [Mycolicibacterium sp. XJ870]